MTALDGFTDIWSPRIIAYINDYDVRLARFSGEHVWPVHEQTGEFFLVLAGEIDIALREEVPGYVDITTGHPVTSGAGHPVSAG